MPRPATLCGLRQCIRVGAVALSCLFVASAGAQSAKEYELKAAFVYNLLLYVKWPNSAFASATSPIVVGIVGRDVFGETLDRAVKDKKINGRSVLLKRFDARPTGSECHLLFFSDDGARTSRAKGPFAPVSPTGRVPHSVLTVGESPGFATSGGMVQLGIVGGKAELMVNLGAVRAAGLDVSSKLLKVAKVINGGSD